MQDLEVRFKDFLSGLEGTEDIDSLNVKDEIKRADYFLNNRQVVVEMKTVNTEDTETKINEIIEPYRSLPEFPQFYGKWDLNKVTEALPNGKDLHRRILQVVTRSIEKHLSSADKQIISTKNHFSAQSAFGVLVLLNDMDAFLPPDVIVWRIADLISQKVGNTPRFRNIDCILFVSEIHVISGTGAKPIVTIETPSTTGKHTDYVDNLVDLWGKYNKINVFQLSEGNQKFKNLRFSSPPTTVTQATRQQLLEKNYLENPYLRNLGKDDLLKYGKNLLDGSAPYFLKGGPRLAPQEVQELMAKVTHFLCEMNHRGLDMRELQTV